MSKNIVVRIEQKELDSSYIAAIKELVKWKRGYIEDLGEEYYKTIIENKKFLHTYLPAEDMINEIIMYRDKYLPQLICIHDDAEIYKVDRKKEYILHPKSKIAINIGVKIMEKIYTENINLLNNMFQINGEGIESKHASSALIKYMQILEYVEKKEIYPILNDWDFLLHTKSKGILDDAKYGGLYLRDMPIGRVYAISFQPYLPYIEMAWRYSLGYHKLSEKYKNKEIQVYITSIEDLIEYFNIDKEIIKVYKDTVNEKEIRRIKRILKHPVSFTIIYSLISTIQARKNKRIKGVISEEEAKTMREITKNIDIIMSQ